MKSQYLTMEIEEFCLEYRQLNGTLYNCKFCADISRTALSRSLTRAIFRFFLGPTPSHAASLIWIFAIIPTFAAPDSLEA